MINIEELCFTISCVTKCKWRVTKDDDHVCLEDDGQRLTRRDDGLIGGGDRK